VCAKTVTIPENLPRQKRELTRRLFSLIFFWLQASAASGGPGDNGSSAATPEVIVANGRRRRQIVRDAGGRETSARARARACGTDACWSVRTDGRVRSAARGSATCNDERPALLLLLPWPKTERNARAATAAAAAHAARTPHARTRAAYQHARGRDGEGGAAHAQVLLERARRPVEEEGARSRRNVSSERRVPEYKRKRSARFFVARNVFRIIQRRAVFL